MPYASTKDIPKYVRKYSPKIQRMWMKVFNKTYNGILKKGGSVKEAEAKAFRMANGVTSKNMEKFGGSRYGHRDWILYLIDRFVKKP